MEVLVLFVFLIGLCSASRLISTDELDTLFKKALQNELSEAETATLQDVVDIMKRPEHFSARAIDYNTETRNTLDCLICRSAFAALFDSVHAGHTDEQLTNTVTVFCVSFNIENHNVCSGAIGLNMPILSHIIRTTPEATPAAFCGLVMQNSHNPNLCPIGDPRFEWSVELPEPAVVDPVPPPPQEPLTIAVLTDAHIDPLYEAFGVANCDEPTCCRKGQNPRAGFAYKSDFDETVVEESIVKINGEILLDLTVAPKIRQMRSMAQVRIEPRNVEPAGYWGDYRDCDTPIWAYDDVIDRISETHKNIDVVYYIGDTIDHGVWETTYELIDDMNRHLIDKMRTNFGDARVVPVIGNHEAQPTNQFAPRSVTGDYLNTTWLYEALVRKWGSYLTEEAAASLLDTGDFSIQVRPGLRALSLNNNVAYKYNWFAPVRVTGVLNTTWLYEALVRKWGSYLTEEAKATLLERGDFSVPVRPGLRAISLNNNVAYRDNWWIVYDPTDAKNHLDWLIDELYKAEQIGEKVHILAHIPPGVADLTHTWTREYNRIVNRFASTIAGEFNGHTHSDEFKIFYNPEGTPVRVAWGAGSATTYSDYNLNYKIASIDTQSFEPTNIVNYVYNLTEANLTPNRPPHWFQLYDMRNSFLLPDLSPDSMGSLVNRMVTTDRHLLDLYSAFVSKLSDTRWPRCGDGCKIDNLCRTVVTVLWERQKCNELTDMFWQS